MGSVTQPWMANVVFRALPPGEFAAFHEPDYVKIVWTLRADPAAQAQRLFGLREDICMRVFSALVDAAILILRRDVNTGYARYGRP